MEVKLYESKKLFRFAKIFKALGQEMLKHVMKALMNELRQINLHIDTNILRHYNKYAVMQI